MGAVGKCPKIITPTKDLYLSVGIEKTFVLTAKNLPTEQSKVTYISITALLWQKEASDKSDISCKRAKCVCHLH